MAGFMDLLSMIFQGLQDPKGAARSMAEANVSPDDFSAQLSNTQHFAQVAQRQPQQQGWRDTIKQQNEGMRGNYYLPKLGGVSPVEQQPVPVAPQIEAGNTMMEAGIPRMGLSPAMAQSMMPPQTPPQVVPGASQGIPQAAMAGLPQTAPIPTANPTLASIMEPAPPASTSPEADYFGEQPTNVAGLRSQAMPSSMNPAQQASVGTTPLPPSAAAGSASVRGGNGRIRSIISEAAARYGQDANTMIRMAGIESNYNPNALNKGSKASGLFQFIPGTARQYGLDKPFDPAANADAAARLMRDNRAYLMDKLGREPTPGELYLAHQQGAGGAVNLLKDPTRKASDVVPRSHITSNLPKGFSADLTAGEFAGLWTNKLANFGGGTGGGDSSAGGTGGGGIGSDMVAGATAAGMETGTAAAQAGSPTAQSAPQSKAKTLADKLAEIGKAITVPEGGGGSDQIPMGSPAPPRPGNYSPNPEAIRTMLAMLGPQMSQQIPTLAQLMGRIG